MILDDIVQATRKRIANEKKETPLHELKVLATSLADTELKKGPLPIPLKGPCVLVI